MNEEGDGAASKIYGGNFGRRSRKWREPEKENKKTKGKVDNPIFPFGK